LAQLILGSEVVCLKYAFLDALTENGQKTEDGQSGVNGLIVRVAVGKVRNQAVEHVLHQHHQEEEKLVLEKIRKLNRAH
jgi:hypothetical protein